MGKKASLPGQGRARGKEVKEEEDVKRLRCARDTIIEQIQERGDEIPEKVQNLVS